MFNGLGFEGIEQARWLEAGVLLSDTGDVTDWFERLWNQSREIKESDLNRADEAWLRRRNWRPTAVSINDFHPLNNDVLLMTWVFPIGFQITPGTRLTYGDVTDLLDNGISLEGDGKEDAEALKSGRWVLVWDATDKGIPKETMPRWFYSGHLFPEAIIRNGEEKSRGVVVESDNPPSDPFEFDESAATLFYSILLKDDFKQLRSPNFRGAWFSKGRRKIMHEFWTQFMAEYRHQHDLKLSIANSAPQSF